MVAPNNDSNPTTEAFNKLNDEPWIPFVEPVPDWDEAKRTYGFWWYIHVYGVAALFILITLYSLLNMIYLLHLHSMKELRNIQQTAYFIAISALMLFFSAERATFMLIDAYNIQGSLHPMIAYLFISIGLPCMTSAFFLIFFAFYKASRSRLARRSILPVKYLIAVIFLHFLISLGLDIAAGFNIYPTQLLIICQSLFVFCALVFAIMFIVLFVRIYKKSVTRRQRMIRIASLVDDPQKTDSGENANPNIDIQTAMREVSRTQESLKSMPQPKVTVGGKLILASAILLIVISLMYLFGLFWVISYEALMGSIPSLWMWWGWELGVRLCEIGLCWTILIAGTQPAMRTLRKKRSTRKRQLEIQEAERRKSLASPTPVKDTQDPLQDSIKS